MRRVLGSEVDESNNSVAVIEDEFDGSYFLEVMDTVDGSDGARIIALTPHVVEMLLSALASLSSY